jgi:hypothetical protein
MDENEIICRYYDHSKGCHVKGIAILTAFYVLENDYGKPRIPAGWFRWLLNKSIMVNILSILFSG